MTNEQARKGSGSQPLLFFPARTLLPCIELATVVALILINGLLAMAELAVVSSRRARLQKPVDEHWLVSLGVAPDTRRAHRGFYRRRDHHVFFPYRRRTCPQAARAP